MTWKRVKLGDVCNLKNGLAFKSKLFKDKGLPILRISNIQNERIDTRRTVYFNAIDYKVDLKKYEVKTGDLLIAMSGATTGKLGFNDTPTTFYLNQRVGKLEPGKDLDKKYLYYLLSTKVEENLKISKGAAQPNLSSEQIKNIEISLPSITEQKQIVVKLDSTVAEINKNINFIKKKEQEVYILKENILSAKFKPSLENKKLNEVCKIVNGGTPDTKNESYWDGNTQWLTPKDMGKLKNVNVINTLRQLTEEGLKNSSASLIPENSIILSCRAPIGHLAINNVPMSFNQGCKGLVPDSTILNYKYLYYFLLSSKKLLNNLGTGTTFKEISSKVLSGVKINVPSLDMQKKIIDKIESIFKELQKLENINKIKVENYLNLKTTLLNKELLSKAA